MGAGEQIGEAVSFIVTAVGDRKAANFLQQFQTDCPDIVVIIIGPHDKGRRSADQLLAVIVIQRRNIIQNRQTVNRNILRQNLCPQDGEFRSAVISSVARNIDDPAAAREGRSLKGAAASAPDMDVAPSAVTLGILAIREERAMAESPPLTRLHAIACS